MKKNIIFSVIFILILSTGGLQAGDPKNVFTEIFAPNGTHPATGTVTFEAYMQARPSEILTEYSPGCDYNTTYPGHITVQAGNFPTPWSPGEVYEIHVYWNGQGPATSTLIFNTGSNQFTNPLQFTGYANADFSANPQSGNVPLTVNFIDESTTTDSIVSWEWDFQNDGSIDSYEQNPTFTYNESGIYNVSLSVSNNGMPPVSDTELKEDYITAQDSTNPQISINTDFIDFGTIAQADDHDSLSFIIHNLGNDSLIINDLTGLSPPFNTNTIIPETIYPSDSSEVFITLDKSVPGSYTDTLLIVNNDIDISLFVTANIVAPDIFVSPVPLNFGNIWIDSTATLPIWVHNVGDTVLNVSNVVSSTDKFTITLPQTRDISFNVASMDSQKVNIHFTPDDTIEYSGDLIFFSNDPENGALFVDVCGTGYDFYANFGANPLTGDIPFEVSFSDSSVGDIINWFWDFGDGENSTEQNPNNIYTTEGNYNVTLTVEDENNFSTITKESYIQAVAHPKICSPDSLGFNFGTIYVNKTKGDSVIIIQNTGTDTLLINNLSLTNNSSAFIYNYNNLNNPILPTGQDTIFVSFNPNNAQTFFDSLLIQNNSENIPELKIPLEGIGLSFYANFGAEPLTGDVPLEVSFTDSSSGFIENWHWDFGDGDTSNLQNPTHSYQYDGSYTVSLTVEDDSLIDTFTREKYIHAIGHPKIFTPDSLGFDFGTISLSGVSEDSVLVIKNIGTDTLLISGLNFVNSNSGFHYTYSNLNTPILPTEEDTIWINFDPTIPQTYFDSLLIQNNSENIPELKIPLEGIGLAFYANFGAEPLTGYVPLEVSFTDSSSGFIENWHWDFGDGNTSNLQNPTHTYQYDDFYTVSLTVEDNYHIDTFVRENYINAIGHPLITSPDTLGINYGPVYLSYTSGDSLIIIENTGTDTVFVSGLSFTNETDGFNYNYPDSEEVLLPTEIDTIYVNFEPEVAQNYYDTLVVENNSENIPELKIPLIGIGEYAPPAKPTGVNVEIDSSDAIICWNPVDTTLIGTPIDVFGYFIYFNDEPDGNFEILGFTTETNYTHNEVVNLNAEMFYQITAFVGDMQTLREIIAINPDIKLGELEGLINQVW